MRLVNDSLVEYSYAAYVAELQYDLKATDMGFEVRFSRFEHAFYAVDSRHRGVVGRCRCSYH